EHIFLFPEVMKAMASSEGHDEDEATEVVERAHSGLLAHASEGKNQLPTLMSYCRRRVDRILKKIDLSEAPDVNTLSVSYMEKTASLDINLLATQASTSLQQAIANKDVPKLLYWYDNKGVLIFAAKIKGITKDKFEQWVVRVMRN